MALAVPLSRFTSRVGGGSAFFVRRHYTLKNMAHIVQTHDCGNTIHWPRSAKVGHTLTCRRCHKRVTLSSAFASSRPAPTMPPSAFPTSSPSPSGGIPSWVWKVGAWVIGLAIAGAVLREIMPYLILGAIGWYIVLPMFFGGKKRR